MNGRTSPLSLVIRRPAGACAASLCLISLLLATAAVPGQAAEPELEAAFGFGADNPACETPNQPGTPYTMVVQSSPEALEYSAARGWGYEVTNPGDTTRGGYGRFGPFDDSPNNRNAFADSCPSELYDSFIGAKNWATPCDSVPCSAPEGVVFRIDVPNGKYRFVAAAGEAANPHATRLVAEDGGSGPPSNLGLDHVVLVHNHDQGIHGAGVFASVGFDDKRPPLGAGPGFVNMDENGLETIAAPSSPTLEVTQGYIRIHQMKAFTSGGDPNGGDLVLLELWRVEETFQAIERGSAWRYFPGTSEASSPDTGAWREPGFDDSGWASGPAPFGYGDGPLGVDLSTLDPPMQGNYTSLFLRQTFSLTDASLVNQLEANVDYDDGFILWINGTEVLRINVDGFEGDPVSFDQLAPSGHESGLYEGYGLPDPSLYLASGVNVVAAQVFNTTVDSSDLKFDLELFDPVAPDLSPPQVDSRSPAPGATVRSLTRIDVTFDEPVFGVDAADLLINGAAADSVSGTGPGPYTFQFTEPAVGPVNVSWDPAHGITDQVTPPNAFAGGSWSYNFDPNAPPGDIVINELLTASRDGLLDEDGEESDWFELRNRGTEPVSLNGWSVTDDAEDERQFILPAVNLGPGEFLVIFASGKDRRPTGGQPIHSNFRLGTEGEFLALYNAESPPERIHAYAPRYPRQRAGTSYGLAADGSETYFATPTPGNANAGATRFDGFVVEPTFTPGRGFFSEAIDVELSSPTPGSTIRYTLDGSWPTPTHGTVYSGAIHVEGNSRRAVVHLRAIAHRDGLLPSEVVTHTYVFPERVLTQPSNPDGFPSSWRSQPADYEMDPDVVNDPGHRNIVRQGLQSIPTLSIVGDVDDIFGSQSGFYANPSGSGVAWERPVSAELIYPDGRAGFQVNCGIRAQGGSSVNNWKVLKISMRLLFKGDYGPTKLRFPLFADTPVESFNTLILDAHLNQTWNHPSHGQRVKGDYIRDVFMSDLQNERGGFAPHDFYANLYINGLYWGLYDIHEKPDAVFAESYFGGDESEWDALKHNGNRVVDGNTAAWNTMIGRARQDLSSLSNYENLLEHLDIVNFADYMLINIWAGNTDWAHHNWYATRRRQPGEIWRFHSWDAEHVLKSLSENRTGVNNSNGPGEIYANLRSSSEFRLLFADRVQKHLLAEGMLSVGDTNRPAEIFGRRVDEINSAIACESARWGDVRRPSEPYTRNDEWLTEINWLMNSYFPRRTDVVLGQLQSAGLYPSVGAPRFSQYGGRIEPGFQLTLSRPSGTDGTIYYTLDGSDPREFGTGVIAESAAPYSGALTLTDTTLVRARVRDGSDWSALTEASFSLGDPAGALVVREIMYHPDGSGLAEFIELENVADFSIDLTGATIEDGVFFIFGEGFVVPPGGHVVLAADAGSFLSRHPQAPLDGIYVGRLDNGGERLRIVGPDGGEILDFEYDDDGDWPVAPDGFGYSLVRWNLDGDPSEARSWRASAQAGGSPGQEDPPAPTAGVVINEILADPLSTQEDAIELFNPTAAAIDIGGWYLSNLRGDVNALKRYQIPAPFVVPSGGHAVLYEGDFNAVPGSLSSFDLSPRGGEVFLTATDLGDELTGYIVSSEYGAALAGVSFGRYTRSNGEVFTELRTSTFGADLAASVEIFRTGGGLPNSAPAIGPVVINEVHYHPAGDGEEFVEIFNPTGAPVSLYDSALERAWRLQGISDSLGTGSFEFAAGTEVPAGGYLVVVGIDPQLFRTLNNVPQSAVVVGPFSGALDNGGERLRLVAPLEDQNVMQTIDEVRFDDAPPWPTSPDGTGPSLERLEAASYGDDVVNWAASTRAGGTPGDANSVRSTGGNRTPRALIDASPMTGTEPLEVFFDGRASYDLDGDIVEYEWSFDDGGTASGATATHTFTTAGFYVVTLTVTDDDGASDLTNVSIQVGEDVGGGQVPGDGNQDGNLDIGDPVKLLLLLFQPAGISLPCEGATVNDGANRRLLDVNEDQIVDTSDAVFVLHHLFLSGPAPRGGARCTPILGCDDLCAF